MEYKHTMAPDNVDALAQTNDFNQPANNDKPAENAIQRLLADSTEAIAQMSLIQVPEQEQSQLMSTPEIIIAEPR